MFKLHRTFPWNDRKWVSGKESILLAAGSVASIALDLVHYGALSAIGRLAVSVALCFFLVPCIFYLMDRVFGPSMAMMMAEVEELEPTTCNRLRMWPRWLQYLTSLLSIKAAWILIGMLLSTL